ncbi:MAG: hypothetical protein ACR2QG_12640, partial [Gammaproteobacteria bacterium]
TSMWSVMPLWRSLDPLPLLAAARKRKPENDGKDEGKNEGKDFEPVGEMNTMEINLQDLFDNSGSKANKDQEK